MTFSRNQFFILLVCIFIGPFIVYKTVWLANAKSTTGAVYFMGHTLELNGGISSHIVIKFKVNEDSIMFNEDPSLGYNRGDAVPVMYQKNDPSNVIVNLPSRVWGDVFVYTLAQALILLILY